MATPDAGALDVQVVYAMPDRLWRRDVRVPIGSTVADALQISGLYHEFPQMRVQPPQVGIYGRRCLPDQELAQLDRIEVYRPLIFDPMESRRRRARHRAARRDASRRTRDASDTSARESAPDEPIVTRATKKP